MLAPLCHWMRPQSGNFGDNGAKAINMNTLDRCTVFSKQFFLNVTIFPGNRPYRYRDPPEKRQRNGRSVTVIDDATDHVYHFSFDDAFTQPYFMDLSSWRMFFRVFRTDARRGDWTLWFTRSTCQIESERNFEPSSHPTMAEETEVPLLSPESRTELSPRQDELYDRFTNRTKNAIVALVSWCGLLPLFVSGSFIPCIPQIAEDFDTTGQVVSLAVSISFLATSVGGLIGASYSSFYGRRPMYMLGLPLLCLASFALGLAQNIPELMIFRFFQALGAAPGLSVGAGVIGDIYALEKRGTAMGIFFGACLLGPALSPLAGGLAAHYSSWRAMQFILGFSGAIGFIFILVLLPETSHPGTRGVDKLMRETNGTQKYAFVNPLKSLWLLRSPNLLAVTVAAWMNILAEYVLLVPLAYTIGVRYNIKNEALLGAFFLPAGLGNIVGAPLAGRWSDQILVKWKKRHGYFPEDRLRASLLGASTLVPLSVLLSGFTITYLDGPVGIVLTLCCLFFNGLGVDVVLNPIGTYSVDIFLSRSAEGIAANKGLRSILVSMGIAGIMPAINHFGIVATHALAAMLAWIGCGILFFTIRYGQEMRDSIDMGYTPIQ
ncbi:putative drug/proton antiporter YHK8 [Mycena venus]|uniref:Putative drug/proton antiporter YHK8 n=1 Tax=Mycena venus TaxID=2733690 RepID=A0A8H6X9S2_9AGAR|nr:putative drug/proton antiporter YHK8 [Mycena venus]